MSYSDFDGESSVLRFITAGSVDDGKSTLIGRLLYDSKAVLADQLNALLRAKHRRVAADAFDLALLTDGLEAEREQGITIDVAYRYFATARRKFIIADTPGHEQYTRNMVTGASTAHAAVILIDATRVVDDNGAITLLPQTKRHSAIVKLLGLRHVIVAINKMDLVDYGEARFEQIRSAYMRLAQQIGLTEVRFVPVSALSGDNVVNASERMPWYAGMPLLNVLETLPLRARVDGPLRFPVQWVVRQDGCQADSFRGYMGRIEAGEMTVGDRLAVLPRQHSATIVEIIAPARGGSALVERAFAGQTVTLRLAEDLDIARGDMLVSASAPVVPARKLHADLCWFDPAPLSLRRKYLLKQTTHTVLTKIEIVERVLDVHTLSHVTGRHDLQINDIGRVALTLQQPIICDTYDAQPATGAFVLIDEAAHQTVAAGMIRTFSV